MCLIALAWRAREDCPLVIAANRDEWRDRPTEPAHWWPDHPTIFAGRDLRARGTWMGMTKAGRFAAVTNFRDPSDRRSTAKSRGTLVTGFLLSGDTPEEFISRLAPHAAEYNGFNLLAATPGSLWYFGSREGSAREVTPGVHALSNHLLDEPWPKVVRARQAMEAALDAKDPRAELEAFLGNPTLAPDGQLPQTGVGLEWERRLSPPLITGDDYGTRSSTTLFIDSRGAVAFRELTRDGTGRVTSIASNHEEKNLP